ncbi:hypothetical protein [Rickettsia oklahomensis]|uniref:Uncharacterized protein n=1 Tax=Rickettsia oklahomensis TaxID=3141789 RepID=A0AAU7BY56_9RICK
MLHTLNDPTASSQVKDIFIKVFGIDKQKDARFNQIKTFDDNIAKFKFTKQALESFISKSEALKIHNKHIITRAYASRV